MVEMIPCRLCGRPWHPMTGAVYQNTFLVCRACEEEFWTWLAVRTNSPPSRRHQRVLVARSFYEAAGDHINRDERIRSCLPTETDS